MINSTTPALTTARSSPRRTSTPTSLAIQIAIPNLDITTGGQAEWFFVNVPSTTTGTMKVTVQSSNLSSLAPSLQVYNSSVSLLGQTSAPNTFGATISLSFSVSSGQGYYIKATDAGGPAPIGGYGLLVNFGSSAQSPIPPPNTVVPQQPDGGGGDHQQCRGRRRRLYARAARPVDSSLARGNFTAIGTLSGWAEAMEIAAVDSHKSRIGQPDRDSCLRSKRGRRRSEFRDCLSPGHARERFRGNRRYFERPILRRNRRRQRSWRLGLRLLSLQAVDEVLGQLVSNHTD